MSMMLLVVLHLIVAIHQVANKIRGQTDKWSLWSVLQERTRFVIRSIGVTILDLFAKHNC